MIAKHSVTLHGHRTSFSLEEEFFAALKTMATEKDLSLAELIAGIDDERRDGENLSSALRIRVLDWALGR
jgi:predicted DNA-binding ribbon-helix-helix protein